MRKQPSQHARRSAARMWSSAVGLVAIAVVAAGLASAWPLAANAAASADGATVKASVGASASADASSPLQLDPLAPGVYVHRGVLEDWGPSNGGDVSNSGLVVGSKCAAVIDTGGTAEVGRRLLAAVRAVTPLPICYVINTHAHPDHVLGNSAFEQANGGARPQFVGHARLAAALGARGPFYLAALRRDFGTAQADARIVPPDVAIDSERVLDLGGRSLRVHAWPTAHTDADVSVLDDGSGTLFLGDLLFVGHTPVVDGKLKGWLAVLDSLRGLQNIRHVVPGHGAVSTAWPGALDAEQHYLQQLLTDVRAALKDGRTLEQAAQQIGPDKPGWLLQDVFQARNVTAAYAELEWEN